VANRPVFIPEYSGHQLVQEKAFEFEWSPGFAEVQKKKNVIALHCAAKRSGILRILEISSKSEDELGRRLSAFSLKIQIGNAKFPLESVYQGSKSFEKGGPYSEVFSLSPRDAKRFIRELNCGKIIGFELEGEKYPLSPKNAFYDWLYIRSLSQHAKWIEENVNYEAFTDIEFNPAKQVNCQARAFAELLSLLKKRKLSRAASDFQFFSSMLRTI